MNSLQCISHSVRKNAVTLASALALASAMPAAHAQLVDGGFDQNPLTTIANVLNNPFASYSGVWGQESAVTTSTAGPFGPYTVPLMLEMSSTGGVATQAVQAVDMAAYANMINNPGANFSFIARFNAARPGAVGGLLMQFFNGTDYSSQSAPFIAGNISLDGNSSSWEQKSITGAVPAGTTWMLAQVYYLEASLVDAAGGVQAGFVDGAELGISPVPEPGSAVLLALGGAVIMLSQRRRARQPG